MIIKAAVARQPRRPLVIETLAIAEPEVDEVTIRLLASGIARADLDAVSTGGAPFPFVPGCGGAGIVERVGDERSVLAAGDAVLLFFQGTGLLEKRRPAFSGDEGPVSGFIDGQSTFATHTLCRSGSLIVVAGDAELEVLAGLDLAMCAAAAAVLAHAVPPETQPADSAVVIAGAGAPGLVAAMVARAIGVTTIIVADPDANSRTLASEVGATLTVHTDDDLAAVVRAMTGSGAQLVLDTTGQPAAIAACLGAQATTGVCLSLAPPVEQPHTASHILNAAHGFDLRATVTRLAAWHADGLFPLEKLIGFFPFELVNDALASLAEGAVVKPVLRFSIGPFADLDRAGAEGAAAEVPEPGEKQSPEDAPPVLVASD